MGIRISKNIGCFLSNEKINEIFVSNYEEIMEDLDYNDEIQNNFFKDFVSFSSTILDENVYDKIMFKLYIKTIEEQKIEPLSLIRSIYSFDNFEGILFSTPYEFKAGRHDDLIDYYENTSFTETIKYLNSPIYPVSGYVYHGGLEEHIDESRLTPGQIYSKHLSTYAFIINEHFYNNEKNIETDVKTLLTEKGFFTPRIDSFMYALAKRANLLKEDVSYSKFNQTVRPAIVTSWG